MGCFGRKSPSWGENPENGVSMLKIPHLGRKFWKWESLAEDALFGAKCPKSGVLLENTPFGLGRKRPISGENPENGVV